jgi:hypothetical protein
MVSLARGSNESGGGFRIQKMCVTTPTGKEVGLNFFSLEWVMESSVYLCSAQALASILERLMGEQFREP